MRKFQSWEVEVWDYKDKEEADKHKSRKYDSGFRVEEEYDNTQLLENNDDNSYTVHYKRIHQ